MNNISAAVLAGAAGLAVTGISGFTVIPWLRKINFGQVLDGTEPKWYRIKTSIPTMGGILPVIGTVCAVLLTVITDKVTGGDIISSGSMVAREMYTEFLSGLITAITLALAGFTDDYLKILGNSPLGLTHKLKSAIKIFISLGFLLSLYMGMQAEPYIFIPFAGMIKTGALHWITGVILIYTAVSAVNITDGIDGLCGGTFAASALTLSIAAALRGYFGVCTVGIAALGASVGFLLWNKKAHCGNVGSLFFAGVLVWLAYSTDCPLMLPLFGASYFIIGAFEIARVLCYRLSDGKRLLKASPLQFHLSKCGVKNGKIIGIFVLINIIGGTAAIVLLHMGGFY